MLHLFRQGNQLLKIGVIISAVELDAHEEVARHGGVRIEGQKILNAFNKLEAVIIGLNRMSDASDFADVDLQFTINDTERGIAAAFLVKLELLRTAEITVDQHFFTRNKILGRGAGEGERDKQHQRQQSRCISCKMRMEHENHSLHKLNS